MPHTANNPAQASLRPFLVGIVAPLAVLVFTLKALRVLERRDLASTIEAFSYFRSDLLLLFAFTLFGILILRIARTPYRNSARLSLQCFGIFWGVIETIIHQFYMATGSSFDLSLLFFSIPRLGELWLLAASEIPIMLAILFALVVAIQLLLPRYLLRHIETISDAGGVHWARVSAFAGLALIALFWAAVPVAEDEHPVFARSSLVNFALTRVSDYEPEPLPMIREPLDRLTVVPVERPAASRNLVIVILESTRASATTLYNPDLGTTPFLDSLRSQSLLVERAYAVVPHTSKALVAMLCGIEPQLTMPITEAEPGGIPARCLPELLADAGYRNVFFQSATKTFEEREGLVKNLGFRDFYPLERLNREGYELANYFGFEDAVMLPASQDWLQENGAEGPFLATYLTLTPHHDYLAPRQRYGFRYYAEDDELNRYLNSVHYVDQFARELLEQYKELGLYEDSIFVFIGDHGEAFGEHGRFVHDNVLWEEGLHVPFLIHDPQKPLAETFSLPVNHLDLLPTFTRLLGFTTHGGKLQGKALTDIGTEERTLFAHCWYQGQCMASITGNIKYIEHFGRRRNEIFNLEDDSGELVDLFDDFDQSRKSYLRAELFGWRKAISHLYSTGL